MKKLCCLLALMLFIGCEPQSETSNWAKKPEYNPVIYTLKAPVEDAPKVIVFAPTPNIGLVYWPILKDEDDIGIAPMWYLGRVDGKVVGEARENGCWFVTNEEDNIGCGMFPTIDSAASWLAKYQYEQSKGTVDSQLEELKKGEENEN
jgi:hypothetical protein